MQFKLIQNGLSTKNVLSKNVLLYIKNNFVFNLSLKNFSNILQSIAVVNLRTLSGDRASCNKQERRHGHENFIQSKIGLHTVLPQFLKRPIYKVWSNS